MPQELRATPYLTICAGNSGYGWCQSQSSRQWEDVLTVSSSSALYTLTWPHWSPAPSLPYLTLLQHFIQQHLMIRFRFKTIENHRNIAIFEATSVVLEQLVSNSRLQFVLLSSTLFRHSTTSTCALSPLLRQQTN